MNSGIFYSLLIILVLAALTYSARLFPFLLFGRGGKIPDIVTYLGGALPPAVMLLLIVYCVRNVDFLTFPYGVPELAGIALALLLYKLTKNNLIAMVFATALFMVLIRVLHPILS